MKDHSVTVTITSKSGGEVNQVILLEEFASTPEELIKKNFAVTDAVIPALAGAMRALADELVSGKGHR